MRPPVRLAAFGAALAFAFGLSFAAGRAVGPSDADDAPAATTTLPGGGPATTMHEDHEP